LEIVSGPRASGTLHVVATPIGNLADLTPRAVRVLGAVTLVACEDTRRTRKLLDHFGIRTKTLSCHKFNERQRLDEVLRVLGDGADVALVTDGGTPGVSDPGAILVSAALASGACVSPLPGASAPVALLSASGETCSRFLFEGFLPHRAGERRRRLRELRAFTDPIVMFESPRRIRATLKDLGEILEHREVVLGRELTKLHETIVRGTPQQLLESLGEKVLGEIALVVAATERPAAPRDAAAARVVEPWKDSLERSGGDRREALKDCARRLGMKRAELYRLLAELGEVD
jgi:16S rRNA (cytidine1402-2'-O)-methyltransferase